MAVVKFSYKFKKTGLLDRIYHLDKTINARTLTAMGNTALKIIEPYVPYRGGTLRQSGKVAGTDIAHCKFHLKWNPFEGSAESEFKKFPLQSYGRYIYEGQVMGPNKQNSSTGAWYSPTAEKTLTGKDIQYHTPGTRSHWAEVIAPNGPKYGDFRAECKRILKEELKNG